MHAVNLRCELSVEFIQDKTVSAINSLAHSMFRRALHHGERMGSCVYGILSAVEVRLCIVSRAVVRGKGHASNN